MKCPACDNDNLDEKLTTSGVVVDCCPYCSGVWLDQGEIFFFSKDPMGLNQDLNRCFSEANETERVCPRCQVGLMEGSLFKQGLNIDHCPECLGLWFDDGELAQAVEESPKRFSLKFDSASGPARSLRLRSDGKRGPKTKVELKRRNIGRVEAGTVKMSRLPNLFIRAAGAMAFLYTILALVLIIVMEYFGIPPRLIFIAGVSVAAFQFLLSPIIMDITLAWFYRCSWISPQQLPEHLRDFVETVVGDHKMKFPRFGLIEDGAPNAFTYGHTPNNARVVITRGVLDLLDEKEVEAVVAHEIGHARHWDILLMTVASLVPLILYYVFRTVSDAANRMSRSKGPKDSGKAAGLVFLVAIGVYVAYIVAQYVVLWFSRTRELHADRFSGRVMENPNHLSSALVKIAYGLVAGKDEDEKRSQRLEAIGSLGIFDANAARTLAFTAYGLTAQAGQGAGSEEATVGAMQWDMWNPWAKWYELHSTHPLVANRLNYLGEQAWAMGLEPYVVFNQERPESYWDEFLVDFLFYILPTLGLVVSAVGGLLTKDYWLWLGMGLLVVGYMGLIRIAFRYRGKAFPLMNVAGLLKKVKVSAIRPVAVTLKGRVIGKGVPGLVWSEDFVMRDDTGIMLLDYRQPLAIWEWLFGLLKAGEYTGRDVEITGWYRRSPVPYVELRSISCGDKARRCYALEGKIVTSIAMMIAGVFIAGTVVLPMLRGLL
jgi:Zn-dependent protease with chaperone function/Zn-finger nucleic acid-binding protein